MDFQTEIIAEYTRELAITRRTFEAIPEDADFTYKPHAKSMPLGRLFGHTIESAGEWAVSTLPTDGLEFPPDHKVEAYIPASKAAGIERFDTESAKALEALKNLAP